MCTLPAGKRLSDELDELAIAVRDLQQSRGPAAFDEASLDVVLRNYGQDVASALQLSKLISVGGAVCGDRIPQVALQVFQTVMKRLSSNFRTSREFEELSAQVVQLLKFGLTSFAAIAAQRVLQFDPHELKCWLKSEAFSSLKTPHPNQLLEVLRFRNAPPRGTLASYLSLLDVPRLDLNPAPYNS